LTRLGAGAYLRAVGRRRLVIAIGLSAAVFAVGTAGAKKPIKPKAGGYVGSVTNANGKGTVRLIYATFMNAQGKPTKAVSLFEWTGTLKCDDGSTRDGTGTVQAPLKGVAFSGKSTSGPQTVSLAGKFTANTKLAGTARLVTTTCDTGPVKFTAHRK
jgi:hypothetical protein